MSNPMPKKSAKNRTSHAADPVFLRLLADARVARRVSLRKDKTQATRQEALEFEQESWRDLCAYLSTGEFNPRWLKPEDLKLLLLV
jgi:hypothetical protein